MGFFFPCILERRVPHAFLLRFRLICITDKVSKSGLPFPGSPFLGPPPPVLFLGFFVRCLLRREDGGPAVLLRRVLRPVGAAAVTGGRPESHRSSHGPEQVVMVAEIFLHFRGHIRPDPHPLRLTGNRSPLSSGTDTPYRAWWKSTSPVPEYQPPDHILRRK